ncbi:hypothetical protein SAMN05660489_06397 [Pseudomonas sp. LAMO17WK12:I10]|uniref:hypothetical protein n=1 Tax=unclassified Pseudomonas TaxID=196821 RepID=UPI000BD49298|nr:MULTISPECIES: hypothetical protein [unclassified Pseudomonas]PXX49612.1 hypothetical protein H160_06417 [Pseudomonas sp. LAMO17WK12:I9]SNY54436.1 hypothetical protein SAMN05660489_06397 [Pseudomonas sp. LAMO17WK12:I10]
MNLDLGLHTYSIKPSTSRSYTLPTSQMTPAALVIDPVSDNDWVNALEKQQGITISGWAEAGSMVLLELGGTRREVLVDATGRWQTIFSSFEVPPDGSTRLSAIVTDATGYVSASTMRTISIDTTRPTEPTLDPVSGDNRITAAEKAAGFTLSGSADPGSEVNLNLVGTTIHWKRVIADATGRWVASFTKDEIPDGTFVITPQAFDQASNPSNWREYRIVVEPTVPVIDSVGGDNWVNAIEKQVGVTVTGHGAADSLVTLEWSGVRKTILTDYIGKWSTTFASHEVPADGITLIHATATTSGHTSALVTQTVTVDTTSPNEPTLDPVAGDNRITAAEREAGVTLSGRAEPGTEVLLRWLVGTTPQSKSVTTDATGKWWTTLSGSEIPDDVFRIWLLSIDQAGNQSYLRDYPIALGSTVPTIDPVTGDNWINAAEKAVGVTVSGRADPGSMVRVDWDWDFWKPGFEATKMVAVDGGGRWSALFSSSELPEDRLSTTVIYATNIDEAGNIAPYFASRGVYLDTMVIGA